MPSELSQVEDKHPVISLTCGTQQSQTHRNRVVVVTLLKIIFDI